MSYYAGSCDVAVIGAGHAGIEAALAAARLGNHTILFTINLDAVGNMPCNPAIGGTGKGHLVRELDALGGEMGAAADHACIQYRMLNRGKGPAVHSLRAQADRVKYRQYMKHVLELQENLELKQAQIVEILTTDGAVTGVRTSWGRSTARKPWLSPRERTWTAPSSPARASSPPAPTGCTPAWDWRTICARLGCTFAASKPARHPVSTAGASIFPKWRCSRGTRRRSRFPSAPPTRSTIPPCAT